jgi:hypothetical protein
VTKWEQIHSKTGVFSLNMALSVDAGAAETMMNGTEKKPDPGQELDGADYALDIDAPEDNEEDIMAMLEEESRKTASQPAVTAADIAAYQQAKSSIDSTKSSVDSTETGSNTLPSDGMEVDDDSDHQEMLMAEWNRTMKQRAITSEDLK